jgi:DoxX-like family
MKPEMVIDINKKLGYAESALVPIGVVLLICTLLYAIPRTAVLGAILLTGYLGGAIATQVRASSPETNQGFGGEASNIIFAFVLGVIIWAGIYLRDARLRALVPFTSPANGAGTGTENR